MYNSDQIAKFNEILPEITDIIDTRKGELYEPTYNEQIEVAKVVMEFVKNKKRKIYGGTAQNAVIKDKSPKDAFYLETCVPDIDCYSPDPITDLYELSNILHEKGFKNVVAQEAQHRETYTINVNYAASFDVSYVPKNIYNRIPFIEIDGAYYVDPSYVYIDLYKMVTDPHMSAWRWEKVLKRLPLLLKHFPFKKTTSSLPNVFAKKPDEKVLETVYKFLKNKESVLVIGTYAYNCYLVESGIKDKNFTKIDVPFYQFVSVNYKDDGKELMDLLKKEYGNDVTVTEHYPLWTNMGYNAYYRYKGVIIAHIIHYSNRCTPIQKSSHKLDNNLDKDSFIQIGCFDYMILTTLVNAFDMKVKDKKDLQHYYNIMLSHLITMRDHYLKRTGKTFYDKSFFQQFIPDCIGVSMDVKRDALERMRKNIEKGRAARFRYEPPSQKPKDWQFANTSGNEINNPSNLKITNFI